MIKTLGCSRWHRQLKSNLLYSHVSHHLYLLYVVVFTFDVHVCKHILGISTYPLYINKITQGNTHMISVWLSIISPWPSSRMLFEVRKNKRVLKFKFPLSVMQKVREFFQFPFQFINYFWTFTFHFACLIFWQLISISASWFLEGCTWKNEQNSEKSLKKVTRSEFTRFSYLTVFQTRFLGVRCKLKCNFKLLGVEEIYILDFTPS